jgi:hypothetical protein
MDRRSLQTFLFSLALLIKVLAPFAAASAMANASADTFFGAPICSHAADSADKRHMPAAPHHHDHDACCPLCQSCHAHHGIGVLPQVITAFARASVVQAYPDQLFVLRASSTDIAARARAPPHFS